MTENLLNFKDCEPSSLEVAHLCVFSCEQVGGVKCSSVCWIYTLSIRDKCKRRAEYKLCGPDTVSRGDTSVATIHFPRGCDSLNFLFTEAKHTVYNLRPRIWQGQVSIYTKEWTKPQIWHSEDRASWYILILKTMRCTNFSDLFLLASGIRWTSWSR